MAAWSANVSSSVIWIGVNGLTARRPQPTEMRVLMNSLADGRHRYRRDPAAALKLVSAGEFPRDAGLDVGELAAYTAIASLILNLDEVITKE